MIVHRTSSRGNTAYTTKSRAKHSPSPIQSEYSESCGGQSEYSESCGGQSEFSESYNGSSSSLQREALSENANNLYNIVMSKTTRCDELAASSMAYVVDQQYDNARWPANNGSLDGSYRRCKNNLRLEKSSMSGSLELAELTPSKFGSKRESKCDARDSPMRYIDSLPQCSEGSSPDNSPYFIYTPTYDGSSATAIFSPCMPQMGYYGNYSNNFQGLANPDNDRIDQPQYVPDGADRPRPDFSDESNVSHLFRIVSTPRSGSNDIQTPFEKLNAMPAAMRQKSPDDVMIVSRPRIKVKQPKCNTDAVSAPSDSTSIYSQHSSTLPSDNQSAPVPNYPYQPRQSSPTTETKRSVPI